MEYGRNKGYQFCDVDLYMVLDTVTGEPERFGKDQEAIGTLEDAVKYTLNKEGWYDRTVVVKLQCVKGFKLNQRPDRA